MNKNPLICLIADMRNRALETRAIIKLVGRKKYTEIQALFLIDREMLKIDDILIKYEKELMSPEVRENNIWHE